MGQSEFFDDIEDLVQIMHENNIHRAPEFILKRKKQAVNLNVSEINCLSRKSCRRLWVALKYVRKCVR